MYTKENLPQKWHYLYDQFKKVMTTESFEVWYDNILNQTTEPLPNVVFKQKVSQKSDAITKAREAVSGYAQNNGVRKAVEALADALENKDMNEQL